MLIQDIPYTHEEIMRLRNRLCAHYYQEGILADPNGESPAKNLTPDKSHLANFFCHVQNMLSVGVYKSGIITQDRLDRFLSHMESNFYRQYKVLFLDSLDEMPLLINNDVLGVLAQWRLEVGR
jgi:hypothetical protein